VAGRPRILTRDRVDELAAKLAEGRTLEQACRELGVAVRSAYRWKAEGEQELGGLSPQGHLALALTRACERTMEPDWQVSAQALDALMAEFAEERLLWGGAGRD
jgi:hypothetical protein